jgi:YD repeat-containing protein
MTRSHWRSVGFALALGSLASANLSAQTETFTYDDLGRLVIVDHGDGKSTTYALDPAGNRCAANHLMRG